MLAAATVIASSLWVGTAAAQDEEPVDAGEEQIDTDSSIGSDSSGDIAGADGSDVADVVPEGPDQARLDAEANDVVEAELTASMDAPVGDPVEMAEPDIRDVPEGSEPDPLADTAPPAIQAEVAPQEVPEYRAPEPGTSSTISLPDAPAADALADGAPLPPVMQLEIDTAGRSRFVDLDVASFAAALDAADVSIELFDDVTAEMTTTVAPSDGAAGSTLYGASGDTAVVTVAGDYVIGQFWVDERQYGLQSIGGVTAVYEVVRDFPDDTDELVALPGPSNGPSGLTAQEQGLDVGDPIGIPVIETMVAYDNEAFAFYGSDVDTVRANAAAMVNLTNQTYRNTGQDQHMNLTHIYATGVTPNTLDMVLYRNQLAAKADGNFDGVHGSRDSNGSDFIVLLSNRFVPTGLCGIAFFPSGPNPAEDEAYNVTEASCALGGLTFTHELGHNQCAGHENLGSNGCGYATGRGYNNIAANTRTIMARNSSPGTRNPVWSKENWIFNGWLTGTAAQDNAEVLEAEDSAPGTISGGVATYRTGNGLSTSVAGIDGVSCIFGSLEDAINTAPTGSTIYVAPGTYPATGVNLNYNISRDLAIEQGTAQCEPTTSGAATNVVLQLAAGATADAVLEISGGADVRLERITIEGGNSAEGTVRVLSSGSSLTLDGAIIRNGNNPSTTLGGGGLRLDTGTSATQINGGAIIDNTAVNGGGVYVDGGTFTMDGSGDVRDNSATDGGGIAATSNGQVNLTNNGDVLGNAASADGGGVHLSGGADLLVTGGFTFLGSTGAADTNTAGRGGGAFVETGSASKVTVESSGQITGNTASFGAGAYLLGGEIEVNDGGQIRANVGGNGAGILGVDAVIDLNAGSEVVDNTGALGAGVFASTGTDLDVTGGVTSGSDNPAVIARNASTSSGGGLYLQGEIPANLDGVHFVDNTAVDGGGLWVGGASNASIVEVGPCNASTLAFEEYCIEFRGNDAQRGGAAYVDGGTLTMTEVAMIDNFTTTGVASPGAQAIQAVGAADVNLNSVMLLGHDSSPSGDGTITGADTADIDITAMTSANAVAAYFDLDGSATGTLQRVIGTTSVLGGGGTLDGACNLQGPGGSGTPNAVPADPGFVSNANTAYMPSSPSAVDACVSYGVTVDVFDFTVKNGDGRPSATEYDMGAVEADTGLLFVPPAWPDFDGDGSADRSVYRPEFGGWYVDGLSTAFLGLATDVPVPADYDGDDVTERAVYRDGAWFVEGGDTVFLGTAGDVPVPGDYDGDGVDEPAVFRDGIWFIEGRAAEFLGSPGDVPVPADYDGDDVTELAVFRPSVGGWYVEGEAPVFFGLSTDVPVPADYTGDGVTDRAVFRPDFGGWYVDGLSPAFVGLSTDVPVPADYTGDGVADRAVFRPDFGGWYVDGEPTVFYGRSTDVPLPLPAAVYRRYYQSTG